MVFRKGKKRVIWWEQGQAASGAAESRQRGVSGGGHAASSRPTPYYGPVALSFGDADSVFGDDDLIAS